MRNKMLIWIAAAILVCAAAAFCVFVLPGMGPPVLIMGREIKPNETSLLLSGGVDERPVADLSAVSVLSRLEHLELSFFTIDDLTPLASLHSLKTIRFDFCDVADLTPLASLPALQSVTFYYGNVADFAPLAQSSALRTLRMEATGVRAPESLSSLSGLTGLALDRCAPELLPAIAGLTRLGTPLRLAVPSGAREAHVAAGVGDRRLRRHQPAAARRVDPSSKA